MGATFCAVAPEHPLAAECAKDNPQLADFVADCRRLAVSEEALEKTEKRGIDTGLRAVHPFDSSRQLPVYVANFVLMQYGSGGDFWLSGATTSATWILHADKNCR